jgi:hypothetical protein
MLVAMIRTCFVSLILLSGCLDFDQFQTVPASSSVAAGGAGGAGGSGGDASGAGGSGGSSTSTGGMGGGGGEGPCGGLEDSFDGGAALPWLTQGGAAFSNDVAVAPTNSSFTLNPSASVALVGCAVWIDVVQDSNNHVFFGWTSGGGTLRFITNTIDNSFVQVAQPGQGFMDQPLFDFTPFTVGTIRIREAGGVYSVETRDALATTWKLRFELPVSSAPWLAAAGGQAVFGLEGAGTDAHFDDFGIP